MRFRLGGQRLAQVIALSAICSLAFWWGRHGEPATRVELTLEPDGDGLTCLRVIEGRPLEVLDLVGIPVPGSGGQARGPAMLAAV